MSQENVELARKAIDALNRGDLDAWLAFLSPDVVWGGPVPGVTWAWRSCTAGGRGGRGEGLDRAALRTPPEGGIHTEIEQLTDLGDDRVFLAIVLTAAR